MVIGLVMIQICFPNYTIMDNLQTESTINVNNGDTTRSWIQRFDDTAEFNRYGIISVGFLLVGIIGGLTVGLYGFDAIWKMMLVVAFSMLALTLMLAVAPIKYITRSIVIAIVVDLIVILLSVL